MNIVLLEPEIPANTGNIARSCVLTGTKLHLIEPLGFRLSDKYLKRSSMDYWQYLPYQRYDDIEDFYDKNPEAVGNMYMATTKAKHIYTDVKYSLDSYIMFGKESKGIPEDILHQNSNNCIRIPMNEHSVALRSLNLSNSVSIILFEAMHQLNFPYMQLTSSPERAI